MTRVEIEMAVEIARLRRLLFQTAQDLSLLVAKHKIGKDRTTVRMTKYLHAEKL